MDFENLAYLVILNNDAESESLLNDSGQPLESKQSVAFITQTRLCNILQYFTAVKSIIFR